MKISILPIAGIISALILLTLFSISFLFYAELFSLSKPSFIGILFSAGPMIPILYLSSFFVFNLYSYKGKRSISFLFDAATISLVLFVGTFIALGLPHIIFFYIVPSLSAIVIAFFSLKKAGSLQVGMSLVIGLITHPWIAIRVFYDTFGITEKISYSLRFLIFSLLTFVTFFIIYTFYKRMSKLSLIVNGIFVITLFGLLFSLPYLYRFYS